MSVRNPNVTDIYSNCCFKTKLVHPYREYRGPGSKCPVSMTTKPIRSWFTILSQQTGGQVCKGTYSKGSGIKVYDLHGLQREAVILFRAGVSELRSH